MSYASEEAVRNAQWNAAEEARETAYKAGRPHVLMRPAIFIDGNKWCALYGENLQDGVAGFGDSPEEAMADFDVEWTKKLPLKSAIGAVASNASGVHTPPAPPIEDLANERT